MNINWTNMAGFGPTAWNQGGPPVRIPMNHLGAREKDTHSKPHRPIDNHSETAIKNSGYQIR